MIHIEYQGKGMAEVFQRGKNVDSGICGISTMETKKQNACKLFVKPPTKAV